MDMCALPVTVFRPDVLPAMQAEYTSMLQAKLDKIIPVPAGIAKRPPERQHRVRGKRRKLQLAPPENLA